MLRETLHQALTCCSPETLDQKETIGVDTALELESIFKIMANSTRLRIVHSILKSGEICVNDLSDSLDMKPQAISNQLQRLVDKGILGSRRNGNNVLYKIENPCVIALLDYGLCILESEKKRHEGPD